MATTVIIGFAAGVIASFVGRFTLVLGIAGALGAIFLAQKVGWYQAGEGASLIGVVAGATILPVVRRLLTGLDSLLCSEGVIRVDRR